MSWVVGVCIYKLSWLDDVFQRNIDSSLFLFRSRITTGSVDNETDLVELFRKLAIMIPSTREGQST